MVRNWDIHTFCDPKARRFPGEWVCTRERPWNDAKAPSRTMDVVHHMSPQDFERGQCPTCGRACSIDRVVRTG
jgi:hypothetical protein